MTQIEKKRKPVKKSPKKTGGSNAAFMGKEFSDLHEIRGKTLMLSLGNAFLCGEVFLKKTGSAIESHLENLRKEIRALKARFPGKLDPEIDTDSMIDDLHAQAQRLKDPDQGLLDKCTAGILGRELEETIGSLTAAVRKIRKKVEGETPAYTARDSVLGLLGMAKTPVFIASRSISLVLKTVIVLILLSLGPFAYLVFTMDKEGALLSEIKKIEAEIQSQKEFIAVSERERAALSQKIQSMHSDDAPRHIKLEIMDANVKIHDLDQAIHRVEAEVENHEDRIRDRKRRIQEIQEKPFVDRLLKR